MAPLVWLVMGNWRGSSWGWCPAHRRGDRLGNGSGDRSSRKAGADRLRDSANALEVMSVMPVITADIMSGMVLVIMAVIIPRIALMTIAAKITKVTEITKIVRHGNRVLGCRALAVPASWR